MGIPRFYRWLSERYPLINENITAEQIPDFDNLYLDMNGIIHNCSHNNTGGLCVKEESDVFVEAFSYICRLVQIIQPKKLLYMAVDGCAPRAKMNQQRSRRFRAANDAREARELAAEMGEDTSGPHFDSNCITPGTEFMAKLTEHLRFFICKKVQEDPSWQQFTIVLSGPDTPGEGEHKIMDYIRTTKAQPGHDPNTRHCLYGLDADLIMLSLASHEVHFALLREEVVFGRRETKTTEQRMLISKDRFQLLHISLLREYLDIEFKPRGMPKFEYNLERIIDDFILFCVLVGNDFLPCLPYAEIGESGLDDLFRVYKDHLSSATTSPWLTKDCGEVDFEQFAKFLQKYGELEDGHLTAACDEQEFVLGKQRLVGPADAPTPPEYTPDLPIEPPPTSELAREQWYDIKFGMDVRSYDGTQRQRQLFQSYLEGLFWVMRYYFRGPSQASWSWYYPYYHAPMALDLAGYDRVRAPQISLELGRPFLPFQQLMAVLPASSKVLLPSCLQRLFDGKDSPIRGFYPEKFVVDMDGVKVPWGGMTLIPFIDPTGLCAAMEQAFKQGPALNAAEEKRNQFGTACSIQYDMKSGTDVRSSVPKKYGDLKKCPVRIAEFKHPDFPAGCKHFPNDVLPGVRTKDIGFPTLHLHSLTSSFEVGVKVFQFESKGQSLFLHLRPTGPFEPAEEAIRHMLRTRSAVVDYPCIHRGNVISVQTPYFKFLADGTRQENDPLEHERKVWNLLQEMRKRGLTVEFDSSAINVDETSAGRMWRGKTGDLSENELCQQPLVEVKILQSAHFDRDGRSCCTYQAEREFRLWHLVHIEKEQKQKPKPLSQLFAVATPVVCIDPESEVFGELGRVQLTSDQPQEIAAAFQRRLSRAEQNVLQQGISEVVQKEQTKLKWHDLSQFTKLVELEAFVVRQIIGTLMVRCADYIREDLGMNFMVEGRGNSPSLCLPCYSIKRQQGWFFSDLAVSALKEYKEKFPGIFEALRNRRDEKKDLEQRAIFPNSPNKDYSSRQLLKYCKGCHWKKLRLVPINYMALTLEGVNEVADVVENALSKVSGAQVTVTGCNSLQLAQGTYHEPPAELFAKEMMLGQRGLYIKPHGAVPCGTQGVVIGVYGKNQELEVLLDEECFGATDLHGRSPRLRGIQVPAAEFLPLYPRISVSGATKEATRSAAAWLQGEAAGSGGLQKQTQPQAEALAKLLATAKAPNGAAKGVSNGGQSVSSQSAPEKLQASSVPQEKAKDSRSVGASEASSSTTSNRKAKLQAKLSGSKASDAPDPSNRAGKFEPKRREAYPSYPSKCRTGDKGQESVDAWRKAFSELLACGKKASLSSPRL